MTENKIAEMEKHLDAAQKILESMGEDTLVLLNIDPTDSQNLSRLYQAICWYFTVKHLSDLVRRYNDLYMNDMSHREE